MAHDVFISYSEKDKSIAEIICVKLERNNIRCWIAHRDIVPSQSWRDACFNAIDSSHLMIVILSSDSNNSHQVLQEVKRAVSKDIIIILFRIEDVRPSGLMEHLIGTEYRLDAITPSIDKHIDVLFKNISIILFGEKSIVVTQAVIEIKELLGSGDFRDAKAIVHSLPDQPDEIRELKKNLTEQIDGAQNHFTLNQQIEQAIEKIKDLLDSGDFRGAMAVIHSLPNQPDEIRELKQNLSSQIFGLRQYYYPKQHPKATRKIKERSAGEGIFSRIRHSFLNRIVGLVRLRRQREVPGGLVDRVHFSITAKPFMLPGSSYDLTIWAHLGSQRKEVIERAINEASQEGIKVVKSKGPKKVYRGTTLTVRVKLKDLKVIPLMDTILWDGEIGNATFVVTVPENAVSGSRIGAAYIYIEGIQIATIAFTVEIGVQKSPLIKLHTEQKRIHSAFASYASVDRDKVLARIQGIQKAAPYLDIFLDVLKLRSGENWMEQLRHEILSRDIMYLFWSQAASRSKWVEWEWRCALREKGIDFVDPVPLVSPDIVPPPEELSKLHFNDWMLAFMNV